jgi:hypothetical protein
MTYIKWIDREIITSPYCIGLCQNKKQFLKELRRLKMPENSIPEWVKEGKDAQVHYLAGTKLNEQCCIVCVREQKGTKPNEIVGLLVHEAVHVWQWIKEEMNEKTPSTEFEAYAIQNIAQKLIESYKMKRR